MAKSILTQPSRALAEFRLLPRLTTPESVAERVSLKTPLLAAPDGRAIELEIPLVAAAMQAVSGPRLGISLAREGGVAFLFCSQPPAAEAEMVAQIKRHKAGFVEPRTVGPQALIREVAELARQTGFSLFPVVDGQGGLLGLVGRNDYDPVRHGGLPVSERMVPRARLEVAVGLTDLKEANARLLDSHQPVLPIVDASGKLLSLVFKRDIHDHLDNPRQVTDAKKRLLSVAAINTHDYAQRAPLLVDAEVDALSIDSSDGHSVYQAETFRWLARNCPRVPVIGGNVVTAAGFDFLAEAGAAAVKVGMGGGTICITQEQKGTGRGLGTAILDVVRARDRHFEKTGRYVPVIADGGVVTAKDVVIALALGADSVMMGRWFARMDESPAEKVVVKSRVMKAYWGEGSPRAREWKAARYGQAAFAEGVEGVVEYAGKLADNLPETLAMVRSSMASCGAATIDQLHREAEMEIVSALSIREGQVHDILLAAGEDVRGWRG